MSKHEAVTFNLPSGAKVTAPRPVAERLGWREAPARQESPVQQSHPDDKPRPVKRSPRRKRS